MTAIRKLERPEKPEISFDRVGHTFLRDENPISESEARAHWDAIDADWTVGAFERMRSLVFATMRENSPLDKP